MIDEIGRIVELVDGGRHLPKFTGDIRYADAGIAVSGNGLDPHRAFLTIGEAITASAAGDRIIVKTGVYDEDGLDMTLDGMELCCEIGVRISNSAGGGGTCLTISGDTCSVTGLVVQQAGQIGFDINGNGCSFSDCIATDCTISYDIDGIRCTFVRCRDQNGTVTGFDIATQENTLYLCNSIGTGGASRGFYLSAATACRNMLYQCLSAGNGTSGYETATGADGNAIVWCISGVNDGPPVDAGVDNVIGVETGDAITQHENITPNPDGEGGAGNPIVVTSQINDETGADNNMNYYGDSKILIGPGVNTNMWFLNGVNLFAVTANDDQRFHTYRVVYLVSATRNAGNAWDAAATVLTVQDATEAAQFKVNDMVWIRAPGYHPDGEVVKVTNVTGAVITIARNVENSGRTGLHWNYTTNDPGNEIMYLCERSTVAKYSETKFDFGAGSAKDFYGYRWNTRRMDANDGLITRMINGTDNAITSCGVAVVWSG